MTRRGGRNDEKVGGGGRRAGGAAVCGVSGGPFDRLRANGFAGRACGGVGGGGAPPGAPGYRLPRYDEKGGRNDEKGGRNDAMGGQE